MQAKNTAAKSVRAALLAAGLKPVTHNALTVRAAKTVRS